MDWFVFYFSFPFTNLPTGFHPCFPLWFDLVTFYFIILNCCNWIDFYFFFNFLPLFSQTHYLFFSPSMVVFSFNHDLIWWWWLSLAWHTWWGPQYSVISPPEILSVTTTLPQYYEAPPALADILAYMNLIFTMLFSLECILKLAAFGIKVHSYYLRLSPFTLGSLSYHTTNSLNCTVLLPLYWYDLIDYNYSDLFRVIKSPLLFGVYRRISFLLYSSSWLLSFTATTTNTILFILLLLLWLLIDCGADSYLST